MNSRSNKSIQKISFVYALFIFSICLSCLITVLTPLTTFAQELDPTEKMLRDLSEAPGVSGYEEPAAQVFMQYLKPYVDELRRDHLGGVIGVKKGDSESPRVMIDAHLDEIGFMVKRIDENGFIKFFPLGWNFSQPLLDRRVVIHTRKGPVIGVMNTGPEIDESRIIRREEMWIDIGVENRTEAETLGIQPGDPITHESKFALMANRKFLLGKAWDDRIGLGVIIGVLKNLARARHPNSVFATGAVQEEITLSGAKTVVEAVKPDIAITLDIDVTSDLPANTSADYAQPVLGKGVVFILHTSEMLPHVKLRQWVQSIAEEMKIPHQFMLEEGGGTDAGPIHKWNLGVPTLDLVISQRYYHSANGIIHRDDYESAVRLITEVVKRLDKNMLEELRFKPLE
ncbi:MAG: M42 family metallopeptidase [candidate division KSB1 bacterium]|nr:M42 family metallopeptidase [candidate division KSB1 bacterium]